MKAARRHRAARGLLLAALWAAGAAVRAADEDKDIELIPQAPPQAPTEQTSDQRQRIFVESAFTLWGLRDDLEVPFPPPEPPHWQARLLLDARKEWQPTEQLGFAFSGRLNLRAEDDLNFPTHEAITFDFREGYASWRAAPATYIDVGRINLKSGVAAGFNPTDFFKTRAVVQPLTLDPTVLREDRLGTVMARLQHIWNGGAFTAAFAPELYEQPTPIYSNVDLPSFNPMFDRTNAQTRLLLKGNVDVAPNFSPELLFYREGSRNTVGANLTATVGQRVVAYLEWAGGTSPNLIESALNYGYQTGTFPPNAPVVLPHDSLASWQNQLSVGTSYTVTAPAKVTFNLEYHYSQAGFSAQDWNHWFDIGHANASSLPVTQQLWYIRQYALDQQQPVGRHTMFLRFDWVDALIPKLELTGFVNMDLHDGSALVQVTGDYYLSNAWTLGMVAAASVGTTRSDFGSLPQAASILFKVARYL